MVPVMVFRAHSDLGPLEAHEGDEIWIGGIAGGSVALPDRLFRVLPILGCEAVGVIGEPPEIEPGAEACEVTGTADGVGPLSLGLEEGQADPVGIDRVGGVDVHVAKEDLFACGGLRAAFGCDAAGAVWCSIGDVRLARRRLGGRRRASDECEKPRER